MGMNIYEKLLARASSMKHITPGEIIWVKPDLIGVTDLNWRLRMPFLEEVGLKKVPKPEKIVAVVDHHTEQLSLPEGAEHIKAFGDWAEKNGVVHFYGTGRGGLQVQVLAEKGHVRPGMVAIVDDTEGEACGALGAFVKSGGQNVWMAIAIDQVWLEVPEVVRCNVVGKFERGVTSIDLRYLLHRDLGESFGKCIEFTGPAIEAMSMDERLNLCSSMYLSGSYGMIGPDEKTIEYVKSRTDEPFDTIESDPDAHYVGVLEYDVSSLPPQVAFPPSPNNTKAVEDAKGIKIHQACLGSCASGRLEDLRVAAHILKGRKIHPRVRMFVTPSSQEIQLKAMEEGLMKTFIEAGAVICIPACGTCPGHIGRIAAGEVCIATSTVNYPGRMGSKDSDIFLAGPATVAASALEGEISDPRNFM